MNRWHANRQLMLRRCGARRDWLRLFGGSDGPVPLGRMRKHRPIGCERPGCGMCKPSKLHPRYARAGRGGRVAALRIERDEWWQ